MAWYEGYRLSGGILFNEIRKIRGATKHYYVHRRLVKSEYLCSAKNGSNSLLENTASP